NTLKRRMVYKIFLDTNIILDLFMERTYELDAIKEIFRLGEKGTVEWYICETIITTTFYILRKEKRIDTLSAFRELCKTVNTIPFSKDTLYDPLEKYKDIEDGLLYFSAVKNKMNFFVTRNVKDFVFLSPSLPVLS